MWMKSSHIMRNMSHQRISSRRVFLSGSLSSSLDSVTPLNHGDSHVVTDVVARDRGRLCLVHFCRRAMACQFEVIVNQGQDEHAAEVALEALDLVDALEDQLSIYRDQSEISQINRTAGHSPVSIESGLFNLLGHCLELYVASNGAFDITSTPLSKLWGFFRRQGRMPNVADVQRALSRVGSCHVRLDSSNASIVFERPDLEINLNGIGKGYALDRCRNLLTAQGIENFVVHGGKSSVLAQGCRADETRGASGWIVAVKHPLRPNDQLLEIELQDQALGTSGSATQAFHYRGKRYGHIFDPRTGWPATDVLSATVMAPSAAKADALSTAFYVLGVEHSLDYCRADPEVSAVIVCAGARSGGIEVHTLGQCDGQVRRLDAQPSELHNH